MFFGRLGLVLPYAVLFLVLVSESGSAQPFLNSLAVLFRSRPPWPTTFPTQGNGGAGSGSAGTNFFPNPANSMPAPSQQGILVAHPISSQGSGKGFPPKPVLPKFLPKFPIHVQAVTNGLGQFFANNKPQAQPLTQTMHQAQQQAVLQQAQSQPVRQQQQAQPRPVLQHHQQQAQQQPQPQPVLQQHHHAQQQQHQAQQQQHQAQQQQHQAQQQPQPVLQHANKAQSHQNSFSSSPLATSGLSSSGSFRFPDPPTPPRIQSLSGNDPEPDYQNYVTASSNTLSQWHQATPSTVKQETHYSGQGQSKGNSFSQYYSKASQEKHYPKYASKEKFTNYALKASGEKYGSTAWRASGEKYAHQASKASHEKFAHHNYGHAAPASAEKHAHHAAQASREKYGGSQAQASREKYGGSQAQASGEQFGSKGSAEKYAHHASKGSQEEYLKTAGNSGQRSKLMDFRPSPQLLDPQAGPNPFKSQNSKEAGPGRDEKKFFGPGEAKNPPRLESGFQPISYHQYASGYGTTATRDQYTNSHTQYFNPWAPTPTPSPTTARPTPPRQDRKIIHGSASRSVITTDASIEESRSTESFEHETRSVSSTTSSSERVEDWLRPKEAGPPKRRFPVYKKKNVVRAEDGRRMKIRPMKCEKFHRYGFCPVTSHYPLSQVEKIAGRCSALLAHLIAPLPKTDVHYDIVVTRNESLKGRSSTATTDRRSGTRGWSWKNFRGKPLCSTQELKIVPGYAKDEDGHWLIILQTEVWKQEAQVSICSLSHRSSQACTGVLCSPEPGLSSRTKCVQRFTAQRLAVLDPENAERCPVVRSVFLPSACVCLSDEAGSGELSPGGSSLERALLGSGSQPVPAFLPPSNPSTPNGTTFMIVTKQFSESSTESSQPDQQA